MTMIAAAWLKGKAVDALIHSEKQAETFQMLASLPLQRMRQMEIRFNIVQYLSAYAQKSLVWLGEQEINLNRLISHGGVALQFMIRQEEALGWLSCRAKRAIDFTHYQVLNYITMQQKCQRILKIMNLREKVFSHLQYRCSLLLSSLRRSGRHSNT